MCKKLKDLLEDSHEYSILELEESFDGDLTEREIDDIIRELGIELEEGKHDD